WQENKSDYEPGKNYFYGCEVKDEMITEEGSQLMALYNSKKASLNKIYIEIQKGNFSKHKDIIPFLKDEFQEIRLYAIDLLSDIGFKSAIEPLTDLLNDLNSNIRKKVYIALTEIALARDVVPYILNGLKDENRYVVGVVTDFITNVIDEDTKPDSDDYDEWLNWWQDQSLKYKPATYYYKGKPVSIKYFINKMKVDSVTAYYLEILLTWTGQNFGDEKTPDILLKWEHWWEENKDRFEPGKRYFYGHLVP
ncbi:MAG: hypothetical protein GY756_15890, partial [bacterium]|nr:hypothetical protein [bacterium]